jgi:hypothetical protein
MEGHAGRVPVSWLPSRDLRLQRVWILAVTALAMGAFPAFASGRSRSAGPYMAGWQATSLPAWCFLLAGRIGTEFRVMCGFHSIVCQWQQHAHHPPLGTADTCPADVASSQPGMHLHRICTRHKYMPVPFTFDIRVLLSRKIDSLSGQCAPAAAIMLFEDSGQDASAS